MANGKCEEASADSGLASTMAGASGSLRRMRCQRVMHHGPARRRLMLAIAAGLLALCCGCELPPFLCGYELPTFSMTESKRIVAEPPLAQGPYQHLVLAWSYSGIENSVTLDVPENLYSYYRQRTRVEGAHGYAVYATDISDDQYMSSLAAQLSSLGQQNGFTTIEEQVNWASAFVQSVVTYAKDEETMRVAEYARYPLETLVDARGDCEDSAILTATLLAAMGYEAVLADVSWDVLIYHIMVGVAGPFEGDCFSYEGKEYYYLETTGGHGGGGFWEIGQKPPFVSDAWCVMPLVPTPRYSISGFGATVFKDRTTLVHVTILNDGSGPAEGLQLAVGWEELGEQEDPRFPRPAGPSNDTVIVDGVVSDVFDLANDWLVKFEVRSPAYTGSSPWIRQVAQIWCDGKVVGVQGTAGAMKGKG